MIKHSVLIISYNQENSIANAIESLLIQKEILHEIVISDDNSQDKTFDVIMSYYLRYPLLIKYFKQEYNVGIFKNLEFGLSKLSGDVVSILAGDDTLNCGVFEEMNRLIKEKSINVKNDYFNIIFNHEIVFPDNSVKLIDNSKIEIINGFKLKIRNLINNRDIGISKNIILKMPILPENLGINTDGIFDDYVYFLAMKNIYTSFVGEKYFAGIGISSKTDSNSKNESMLKVLDYIKIAFNDKLENEDLIFLKIEKMYFRLKFKFSFFLWLRTLIFAIFNPGCFIIKDKYLKYLLYIIVIPIRKAQQLITKI